MEKINNFLKSKKGLITVFIILYFLLFFINLNTIWAADDYAFYNNVWLGEDKFSILRAFTRSKVFYLTWTGRFLSTFMNYLLLYFPKMIYNIINPAVYVGLIYIIYKIVQKDKQPNGYLALGCFMMTWLFIPAVGQVIFWQIGSVIYLWMFFLVLLLIYFYTNLLKKESKIKDNLKNNILLFILGIVAGNGFETNSIVLLCFLFLTLVYLHFFEKRKLPIWSITCFIGSVIGSCTNFFSPGNAVRMGQMGTSGGLIEKIIFGAGPWFYNGIVRSKIFLLITILIVVYCIYVIAEKKSISKKTLLVMTASALFICCLYFFIGYVLSGSVAEFLKWFYPHYKRFWVVLVLLGCSLLIMIFTIIWNRKEFFKDTDKTTNYISLIYVLSGLVGVSAYIMTPTAWPRSYMGMSITLITAIIYIYERITKTKKNGYVGVFIIMMILSSIIYSATFIDTYKAKKWEERTVTTIKEKINAGETIIYVDTLESKNNYNAASIERWVIPIEIEGKIPKDYEWINIEVTKYYFNDPNAWKNGKRIIGRAKE